ncbi:methyltransferase domain-containing protein [Aquihabitans sp. G128]|uniref:class I SAM-dependent methyltransferase n=1 Tax=Aquihabitans sp. G128 TaxID=2849779 RepID=UPI001C24D2D3|nr:methyltransferase domain-containing protein [Aquihabitans sp. G128]QXC59208.1 methyltransferase domain-containing protein [Aquihabitans sp. G128]
MSDAVEQHYSSGTLQQRVLDALVASGLDPDHLAPEALGPMEEFHTFGPLATIALADAAGITATDRVLDVGSGLGGPARLLARRHGCHVTGIDLTQELVDVAVDLTRRVGLVDRVELQQGDALDLPFPDAAFDVVWTQHVTMNIAAKADLFAGMRRVCKPGGRLAFFDILAGDVAPIHLPVPWAEEPSVSHLATSAETQRLLVDAGFTVRAWDDLTTEARAFYDELAATPPAPPQPLGLHLLIPDMATKGANLARNVAEGRIALVRCIADAT